MTWVEFGQVLMLERIIAGDRGDFANALRAFARIRGSGSSTTYSSDGAEVQRTVMRRAVDKFRMAVKRVAREAYEAGLTPRRRGEDQDESGLREPSTRSSISRMR